jgi:hypothetical protein
LIDINTGKSKGGKGAKTALRQGRDKGEATQAGHNEGLVKKEEKWGSKKGDVANGDGARDDMKAVCARLTLLTLLTPMLFLLILLTLPYSPCSSDRACLHIQDVVVHSKGVVADILRAQVRAPLLFIHPHTMCACVCIRLCDTRLLISSRFPPATHTHALTPHAGLLCCDRGL